MNDCIEWAGSYSTTSAYGVAYYEGRNTSAHRVAYCEHHKVSLDEIKGLDVCHSCDNPRCVNVAHLFLGTHRQNMQDASRKGRMSSGARHTAALASRDFRYDAEHARRTRANCPKGVHAGQAKFTQEQVDEIRVWYAGGNISQAKLGTVFGVSQSVIGDIVRRRTYK